eukprot:COSAG05_NODE_8132_length_733_cov_170.697161_1_plen_201_part_01
MLPATCQNTARIAPKEKDASPNELRINAVFQKLRSLQGKEIIVLVKNKWHHRVGLMPSFASNLIKVVLKFTDDSSTSSTERLNKAWCEALSTILDMSVTSLRKTEEKSLSKAVSVMIDALRLCLPQVGKEAPTNSVAIIDLWADVDSTFDNYPYPKTGATSGCFDFMRIHLECFTIQSYNYRYSQRYSHRYSYRYSTIIVP